MLAAPAAGAIQNTQAVEIVVFFPALRADHFWHRDLFHDFS
jgi:hypothetical protein